MPARKNSNDLPKGFVKLPWELLNSEGYKALSGTAAKVLPYFLGKVRGPALSKWDNPRRYIERFKLSYPEAEKLGFPRQSFARAIRELENAGFIKIVEHGGLRGKGQGYNFYTLSEDWNPIKTMGPMEKTKLSKEEIINMQHKKLRDELNNHKSQNGTYISPKTELVGVKIQVKKGPL